MKLELGSSFSNPSQLTHQGHHRCESVWQNCLLNVSHKTFRDFGKTVPTVWFTLLELKLQQCAFAADEESVDALLS